MKLDRIKFTEYLMKNTNINDLIDIWTNKENIDYHINE